MASGRITLSYTTTSNGATSATIRVTMTYYGNGETWNSSPSSNNCYITLNGTTKYFTHAYTTSTSAQTMGYADFTITKSHSTQSLTATGGITNYSTYYSDPTGSCSVSVSAKTSYTISYNANGKGTNPSSQTKWYGETLTLQPAMNYSDWTFVGWNTSSTATTAQYNGGGSYTSNAGATLYAIWKKNITLTYNANEGSDAPSAQTNTIYNTATSTNFTISTTQPTRSNYNFLGWANSGSTTVAYQPGDTISNVSDDKTIDAQWQIAYTPPQITSLVCYRSQSSSTSSSASDTGGYGIIKMDWSLGNDGDNLATQIKIEYKLSTETSWTTKLNWTSKSTSITSYSTYIGGTGSNALSEGQYDVRVSVRNSSYTSYATSKTSFISATFFTIDINETGTGIGLLTSAPSSGINIDGKLNFPSKNQIDGAYLTYKDSRGDTSLRPTSADIATTGINGITAILASSQMTTNRPGEGTIIHCEWDTTGGWNAQLFVADNDSGNGKPFVAVRGQRSGTWTSWDRLLAQSDVSDYVITQGSSTESTDGTGIWRWREWNSGKVEIWYSGSMTLASLDQSGTFYRSMLWKDLPNNYALYRCTILISDFTSGGFSGCGGKRDSSDGGTQISGATSKFQIMSYRLTSAVTTIYPNIYICGQKTDS